MEVVSHREEQFQEMDQNSIENLINKMRLERSRLLDLEYSYLLDTLAPENTIPAQPITDSRLFSFEDLGGSAPSKVTNEQVHQRRLLHNFSNIQQASINISGPYIGKWDGKVKTCK